MKRIITTTLGGLLALVGYSQTVTTSICDWKDDATGAYNFIHDDYGDNAVIGINNYADTMAYNRGLKFTFGAISSQCEANAGMWSQAIDMMNLRGHEMMSHSHNHYCAHYQNWDPCDITSQNWGDNNEFDVQIDQAHQSIITNTGHTPVYYIYPYDQFTTSANDHLKTMNYIGSRTGTYNAYENANFTPDADGFFRTALVVDATAASANNLNYWVDQAISNGSWVNREMHNVGNVGWGTITLNNYRNHLDYVKSKVDAGELWVGTISEVLTYQIQKINYTPTGNYNSSNDEITVTWNNPNFNVANYLAPLTFKSPITVKVDLNDLSGINDLSIKQSGNTITDYTLDGSTLLVNVYPHEGSLVISNSTVCPTICISIHPQSAAVNEGSNIALTVSASSDQAITYTWLKNGNSIIGAPNANTYNLSNVSPTDAGQYSVQLSNALGTITSNEATIAVQSQTPYLGSPINIPGKLEFEDFDFGGQGISYNETTSTNQEANTSYRSDGVPVDVGILGNGTTFIGYTTPGEWLEYTVNIAQNGAYDFTFSSASAISDEDIILYLDDNLVNSPTLTLPNNGSWTNFVSTSYTRVELTGGLHTLKVLFTKGNVDVDYVDIQLDPINYTSNFDDVSEFKIFPNPFDKSFHIESYNNYSNTSYKIYDVNGSLIESGQIIDNQEIILGETLDNGIYFLQLDNDLIHKNLRIVKN